MKTKICPKCGCGMMYNPDAKMYWCVSCDYETAI